MGGIFRTKPEEKVQLRQLPTPGSCALEPYLRRGKVFLGYCLTAVDGCQYDLLAGNMLDSQACS